MTREDGSDSSGLCFSVSEYSGYPPIRRPVGVELEDRQRWMPRECLMDELLCEVARRPRPTYHVLVVPEDGVKRGLEISVPELLMA